MKYNTHIAGVPHSKPNLDLLKVGDKVDFVPEPENQFDPNAIRIQHTRIEDSKAIDMKLGYVPKTDTGLVRELKLTHAFITSIDPTRKWKEIFVEVGA